MTTKPCSSCLIENAPKIERRKDSQILNTLMNYSRDIILFVRYQDGQILEANSAAEQAYGYSRQELLQLSLYDIRASEAVGLISQQLAEARNRNLLFETLHRHKDGTIFPVEVSSKEAVISGESVLVSIVRDISERKKSDAALHYSQERFRRAVDSMPDVVVIYDRDLRIQYVNPATLRRTGRPAGDFLGRYGREVWPKEVVVLWRPVLEKAFASGEVQAVELDLPTAAGMRHLAVTCVPMRDGKGRVQEVMSITHDLTTRKKSETALRKSLLEKEVLLQEIHHRVKNNMQVINSLMNLQAAKIRDAKLQAYFREATSRVHVMALIHDNLYRSENLSEIDLQPYIEQLAQSVMRMYTVAGVKVEIRSEPIHLDMDQAIPCGLIINELATNALKYAFAGRDKGRFIIEAAAEDGGQIRLAISDDGVGLPPQVDFNGTETLGLKLVYGLVNQLGGTIELQRPEKGTRYTIRFPLNSVSSLAI